MNCLACGGTRLAPSETLPGGNAFMRCVQCGLEQVKSVGVESPLFADFSAAGDALLTEAASGVAMTSYLTPNEEIAFAQLQRTTPTGAPVLEVCCESGRFMALLTQHTYRAMGVDPFPAHARVLEKHKYAVRHGGVDAVPTDWPTPATVVLLESLVRYPEPVALFQSIRARFPEATLITSVPSRRSLKFPAFDRRMDYPPHFVTRWTAKALQCALARAGYTARVRSAHVNLNVWRGRWIHRVLKLGFWIFLRMIGELDYSYVATARPVKS